MKRTNSIIDRLPFFYRSWDRNSLIFNLLFALGNRLDEAEKEVTDILRSHWVDTSFGNNLDKLGAMYGYKRKQKESDTEYRNRLKQAVIEFKGGGTINALMTSVKMTLGLSIDYPLELVENPPVEVQREFDVNPGDTWTFSSESVLDAAPSIELTIESESEKITNPSITNLETNETITYKGSILKGQKLVIEDGKGMLDKKSVKGKLSTTKVPKLLRKQHKWKYEEPISEEIGVFDAAIFDESKFAIDVPTVKLSYNWVSYPPATFEIRIPQEAIAGKNDLSLVEDAVNTIKANGVRAIINIVKE
ncbi:hypothetical protein ACFL0D_08035 [Thermoproteota archaeon]